MRLKRDMIWVLFRQVDADLAPIIEAMFDSPEAMARYFVNHDLAKRFRLGHDEEIYPKFTSKKFKFYSLVEATRAEVKKKVEKKTEDVVDVKDTPEEIKEDDETKEVKLDDLLEEDVERPDAEEGDK